MLSLSNIYEEILQQTLAHCHYPYKINLWGELFQLISLITQNARRWKLSGNESSTRWEDKVYDDYFRECNYFCMYNEHENEDSRMNYVMVITLNDQNMIFYRNYLKYIGTINPSNYHNFTLRAICFYFFQFVFKSMHLFTFKFNVWYFYNLWNKITESAFTEMYYKMQSQFTKGVLRNKVLTDFGHT